MKKGQEWIGGIFTLLLVVVIAGFALPTVNLTQATKVSQDVEAKEFENKAILFANALMSDPNFVYFDSNSMSYQRGVFDKTKLDSPSDPPPTNLFYPSTYAVLVIKDKETGKVWKFYPKDKEGGNVKQYLDCTRRPEITEPIKECAPERFSTILDNGFPIAIAYPNNDVHIGLLELTVVE